jgi:hypothetical protein
MPDPETCEACGAEFRCGAREGGCWCTQEHVPAAVLGELRERYGRCLCPACLRAAAAAAGATR